jgi:GAF domain-containing protein/AmiR/NasT family two-component response regulator
MACSLVTERLRVLITDDNKINRKLLRVVLEAENQVVLEADNGISALKLLEQTQVDAIISDILMPEMDGYRLCYEIRKNPKLRTLPFIVYTASYTSPSDEKVALQFGVDKFLRKPASSEEIVKSLHEVLASAKVRARDDVQIPEEAEAMREYNQVLVRKLEETIVDLSAANQALQTLFELSQKILNTLDLQKILQEFLDKALSIGPFDLGVIRLFEPNNESLRVAATKGYFDNKNISYLTITLSELAIGVNLSQVISQRKTLIAENVLESEGWGSFKREGVQSAIMFPIWTEEEILGIVQLGSRKRQKIPSSDASLLEALASQAGVAIQKARLYEQTQRNFERIKALHEIDLAITSTLDLRQSLDVLLEKIDIFLPFPAASTIRLLNAAAQKFENTACRNINEQEWKLGTGRGTGQLSREFLKSKGPVIIPNIQTDIERKSSEFFRKHGFVSYLGVPLIAKGNIVGILGFYTREAHEFTQQEIDFLTTLAGQAAIAIHNARLYEETERRRHEAEELARVAGALTETLDPTVVGERIVTSVRELFGVRGSTLRLRHVDGSFRRLASSGDAFSQTSAGDAVLAGAGLTSRAIAQEKPVWSRDILNDPDIVLTDEMRDYQISSGNRSMIVARLRAHDKLIGTLSLTDRTGRTYSDNEVALLQTFSDQAALALENARLYEQTERQLKRIEGLREIEKSITSTLDLSTVLNILMEKIDLFLGYPAAATVRLFDEDSGLLEPVAARNIEIGEWVNAMRGIQHNAKSYGRVVIEKEAPLIIANLQTDPRTQNSRFYREHGLISYAGVPLIAKDEVLGVLGIYTKEGHSFSNEEIALLMVLAGQAAIAIQNARLYEETHRSRKELETTNQSLERSLRQLDGLHTALAPIAAARSIQEAIGEIIDRLIDATGADAALIRTWDKDARTYSVIGQRGFSEDYLNRAGDAAGGAVEWVITHSEPIIAPDIASDSHLKGKLQLQLGLQSCAILPLKIHNEVRGVIHVSSRQLGYFDEEQKDHLTAIARQMSIAMENRELFNNLKSSRDELERANKVKDEFLSVMSHELRTPLNVIMGYTALLKEAMLGEINPEQMDATSKIMGQCRDLLVMVNSILQATQLGSGQTRVLQGEYSLSDLLDELKSSYTIPQAKELTISWDYPAMLPTVKTDEEKLKHILQNLINNAVKFTAKGQVVISARVIEGGMQDGENRKQVAESSEQLPAVSDQQGGKRWLEFQVADTGVGIPQEQLPVIFDMFRQVDSSETRPYGGTGLGLYIVKKYLDLLGGKVEVDSELGKGSTFTVVIPCEVEIDSFQPTEATRR